MFGFNSLYSSSSGNSFLVQTNNTKILIDAGVSEKKISNALSFLNIDTKEISAILVTHEHSDHISGLNTLYKKHKIPVYVSQKTHANMSNLKIDEQDIVNFESEEPFTINDLCILPFKTSHDAADPCGFCISNDEKKITIATDLGYVSDNVYTHLQDSNFVLLESNYEPNLLEYNTKYPWYLKKRIAGNKGHLSNQEASNAIASLHSYGLGKVMLAHLSKNNNLACLAREQVAKSFVEKCLNINEIDLTVAPSDEPSCFVQVG